MKPLSGVYVPDALLLVDRAFGIAVRRGHHVMQTLEGVAERVSEAGKELALDLAGEAVLTKTVASPHSNLSSPPVFLSVAVKIG
jgi:hypothetical protein